MIALLFVTPATIGLGLNWILLHYLSPNVGGITSLVCGIGSFFILLLLKNTNTQILPSKEFLEVLAFNTMVTYMTISFGVCMIIPTLVKTLW